MVRSEAIGEFPQLRFLETAISDIRRLRHCLRAQVLKKAEDREVKTYAEEVHPPEYRLRDFSEIKGCLRDQSPFWRSCVCGYAPYCTSRGAVVVKDLIRVASGRKSLAFGEVGCQTKRPVLLKRLE